MVVRIARVESQAAVSRLQQMKKHATVAAAVFANKVLQYLKKTATSWHLGDFVIGSISYASHADEHCEQTGESYRSQGGRMTILATRSLVDQAECGFHLIACTSNTLTRVCRSALTAETYQMELVSKPLISCEPQLWTCLCLCRGNNGRSRRQVQSSWYG